MSLLPWSKRSNGSGTLTVQDNNTIETQHDDGTMGPSGPGRITVVGRWVEDSLGITSLLLMAILPVLELILRTCCNVGIPGTTGYVRYLTLWVGMLGATIATRSRRHLSLSTGTGFLWQPLQTVATAFVALTSVAVTTGLFWAAAQFMRSEMESPASIGGWLPTWIMAAILPVTFAIIFRTSLKPGWCLARS